MALLGHALCSLRHMKGRMSTKREQSGAYWFSIEQYQTYMNHLWTLLVLFEPTIKLIWT